MKWIFKKYDKELFIVDKWWNRLSTIDKSYYTAIYYPNIHLSNLSLEQIKTIYLNHNKKQNT